MKVESKYYIKGQIIQLMWQSTDRDPEGTVFDASLLMKINDKQLLCFYAIEDKPLTKRWFESNIGKDIMFSLHFLDFNIERIESTTQTITSAPVKRAPNRYVITGKIVDMHRHDTGYPKYDLIILDCGLPISISVDVGKYKIGEFIKMDGRLDIVFE